MSRAFERAWEETGKAEGGYVNDPSDSGGETNWGITKRVAPYLLPIIPSLQDFSS